MQHNAWVPPRCSDLKIVLEWKYIIVMVTQHTAAHNELCPPPLTQTATYIVLDDARIGDNNNMDNVSISEIPSYYI